MRFCLTKENRRIHSANRWQDRFVPPKADFGYCPTDWPMCAECISLPHPGLRPLSRIGRGDGGEGKLE
jgi:hypothetical protein